MVLSDNLLTQNIIDYAKTNQEGYLTPKLEVLEIAVEQRLSLPNLEDPVEGPEQSWK